MKSQIVVSYEGDYVQVLSDGKKDYQFANKLWTEVVKKCKEKNCYRVLGIAQTSRPVTSDEAYHHKDLFKDIGSAGGHRSAAKAVIPLRKVRKIIGKGSQDHIKKWITEIFTKAVTEKPEEDSQ